MKGGETTDKWDVLVSYDQGKLQKYLKAAWAKTHRVASAEFKVTTMIAGHEFEEDFKLTIEDPTLEFYQGSNEARARLTMDISGTSTSKQFPNEPLTIDRGNFSLQVTLPVKAIHGDGGSTIVSPAILTELTIFRYDANLLERQKKTYSILKTRRFRPSTSRSISPTMRTIGK